MCLISPLIVKKKEVCLMTNVVVGFAILPVHLGVLMVCLLFDV